MTILPIHKLFFSSQEGWDEVARIHPNVINLYALLVLPLSLLPPLMLEYAGRHFGTDLYPASTPMAWSLTALTFLLAELVTVPLMAWGIQSVANSKGIACDFHDAFTLAAIAPVPLWLSSLALFSGDPVLVVLLAALGLGGSVLLIFRGVEGILKVKEDVVAFELAFIVTGLGMIAWALLLVLGLMPALA
jgi:hypothetical protein